MIRSKLQYIFPFMLAVLISAGSCTGRHTKAEHRNLIPEDDLVLILRDVYLADGLLSMPGISDRYLAGDSISSYIDVIKSHGYSKPQMDRTMRFYFVKKPKRLVKIYDRVLGNLSAMESIADKELPGFTNDGMNIWPGWKYYSDPDPLNLKPVPVDYLLPYMETYNISYTITLYPDDQTLDPQSGFYLSHTDTAGNEMKVFFTSPVYIKDGLPHTYNILKVTKMPSPIRLKGWFINLEGTSPGLEHNYTVRNIFLSRNRL